MAEYNPNRLQFVHHNECFSTVEEAKAYIIGQLDEIDRPALYAEPMVLKYGDERNPNILLAIGSVGDGKTKSHSNKTFFIDSASIEASIAEIKSKLADDEEAIKDLQDLTRVIINSCGLENNGTYIAPNDPILKVAETLKDADIILSEYIQELENRYSLFTNDTDSVTLNLNKAKSGQTLTADVKLSKYKVVDNVQIPNIILVENGEGLFTNVDLTYSQENNSLTFSINGVSKIFDLPTEKYLVEGVYEPKLESLILTLNTGDKVIVDVAKLIGEWTVLGENSKTPIVLNRRPSKYEEQLHEIESYQDVLEADVRVANDKYNVLKKTEDGRNLRVDGRASKLLYETSDHEFITIQEAIDTVDCKVSSTNDNIISKRIDGLFANVTLDYNSATNTIIFKRSNNAGGVESYTYQLNSAKLLDRVYYDSSTESIVLIFQTADKELSEVVIPVKDIIEEWDVDNTNTTVTLNKKRSEGSGHDKLSANVNISNEAYNIVEEVGHGIYVRGTADNIKFDEDHSVEGKINEINNTLTRSIETEVSRATEAEGRLNSKIEDTNNLLNNEVTRAQNAEHILDDSIKTEVTRATRIEQELQSKISLNSEAIRTEETRATKAEEKLQAQVTTNADNINEEVIRAEKAEEKLQDAISTVDTKLTQETKDRISEDTLLDGKIDANAREIVNVKAFVEKNKTDILFETDRAEKAENDLMDAIIAEKTRAEKAEEKLQDAVKEEEARAIASEVRLQTNIDKANVELTNTNNELGKEITRAKDAENNLNTAIEGVATNLGSEINRATGVENVLSNNIADTNTNLIAEQTRAEKAEEKLQDAINEEKTRANNSEKDLQTQITTNTNAIDAEVVRATGIEDGLQLQVTVNSNAISGEIVRAKNAERDLQDAIDEANVELKGNIDTITLNYNAATNTLEFKNGNGEVKELKLNNADLLNNAYYDSVTETLVMSFKNEVGEIKEVRIPVKDIIEEWNVDNSNKNITLVRTRNTSGTDTLTANVNISTKSGNLLQDINNSLYVSNSANDIKLINGTSVESVINATNNNLSEEINRAQDAEKVNADAIKAEETRAINSENDLQTKITENINEISEEITRAKNTEKTLSDALNTINTTLNKEVNDRTIADLNINARIDTLSGNLMTEITYRENSDTTLDDKIKVIGNTIESIENTVITEESDRKAKDTELEAMIVAEKNRAERVETANATAISNEVTRATRAEESLKTQVEKNTKDVADEIERAKAAEKENSVNILNETNRATTAENANSDAISNEKTRAVSAETKLDAAILAETNRAKNAESANTNALNAEITRAKSEEGALTEKITIVKSDLENKISQSISGVSITPISTETINLVKEGLNLSADVKVSSTDGNIINLVNDGIYAKGSKLTYSNTTNTLTFIDSLGKVENITLNVAKTIDSINVIEEDGKTYIQFTYNGGQKVKINAADFFKGIVGSDASVSEGHNITVTTALTTSQGSTSTGITANLNVYDIVNIVPDRPKAVDVDFSVADNKLLGKVGVSTQDDNILGIDNKDNLYVKGVASNIQVSYKNETTNVQATIADIASEISKNQDAISKLEDKLTELKNTVEAKFVEIDKKLEKLLLKSTIIDDDYNDYLHQTFSYVSIEDGGDGKTHVQTELKEDLSRNPKSGSVSDF